MADTVGTSANETLTGTAGDDYFDGMGGADTFVGGTGDDGYLADSVDDVVTEVAGEGTDRVYAGVSYTLGAGTSVEILTVAGTVGSTTAIDLTGNELGQHLWGNDGANILRGMAGLDWLFGYGGDDRLEGGADTDFLLGGAGADLLLGGTGDDFYILQDGLDTITEEDGEGIDVVYVNFSYTLAAGEEIEFLSTGGDMGGTAALDFTGNEYNNLLLANAGVNILLGHAGNDVMYALAGTDTLTGGAGADTLFGGDGEDLLTGGTDGDSLFGEAGEDELHGGDGNDSLIGGANVDMMYGDAGNDGLDGGTGADRMFGGDGDDYYTVDNGLDTVTETSTGGNDRVYALVSYVLAGGSYVESLIAAGSDPLAAINLTGNELGDNLHGNEAANTLRGEAGIDWLFGNGGDDTLYGGNNTDYLIGGAGADTLRGEAGDDFYILDDQLDTVIEAVGAGYDTVYVSASFTIAESEEIEAVSTGGNSTLTTTLDMTGNSRANWFYGNNGVNNLLGNGGVDTIFGFGGNDALDGGTGNDFLYGGDGDDSYYVDSASDYVSESNGGGIDTLYTTVTYTIASGVAQFERMAVRDQTSTNAVNLASNAGTYEYFGNNGVNTITAGIVASLIYGYDGDDIIYGRQGNDTIYAGDGNDTIYVDDRLLTSSQNAGDDHVEAGAGNDTIWLDNSMTGTVAGGVGDDIYRVDSPGLADNAIIELVGEGFDTLYVRQHYLEDDVSIEKMIGIYLQGNNLDNIMVQTDNGGFLRGEGGNDRLIKGLFNGTLTGGTGNDVFDFSYVQVGQGDLWKSYHQTITDFTPGEDRFEIGGMMPLPPGQLAANAFHLGSTAADADDRILYDSSTGKLYYDADGTGSYVPVWFASVTAGTVLDNTSFYGI